MAKEKTRGLKLILSYQIGLNKSLLCSGLDLDGNDDTEKLNVLFICLLCKQNIPNTKQLLYANMKWHYDTNIECMISLQTANRQYNYIDTKP